MSGLGGAALLGGFAQWLWADPGVALLVRYTLACVFLAAGLFKISNPAAGARALTTFAVRRSATAPEGALAGVLECAVGVLLLGDATSAAGEVAAAMMAAGFVVVISRAIRRGTRESCYCLSAEDGAVSWSTLARAAAMFLGAGALIVSGAKTSAIGWPDRGAAGTVAVAAVYVPRLLPAALRVWRDATQTIPALNWDAILQEVQYFKPSGVDRQ